jgi:hypothetical protein
MALIAADRGAAAGMHAYEDATNTCLAFLRGALDAQPDLRYFLAAQDILRYVEEDSRNAADRLKCGWNEDATESVRLRARELVDRPVWEPLVLEQLESAHEEAFYRANQAAIALGLNVFDLHWRRVQADPHDSGNWFRIMQAASATHIDPIIEFAEGALPLQSIATGPADELGMGKEFEAHSCLDYILQDLHRFPGKGRSLILAGLRSPVVRNRHMALNALAEWDPAMLAQARDALVEAQRDEVDEDLKVRIE